MHDKTKCIPFISAMMLRSTGLPSSLSTVRLQTTTTEMRVLFMVVKQCPYFLFGMSNRTTVSYWFHRHGDRRI
jgi:hypothetical protein